MLQKSSELAKLRSEGVGMFKKGELVSTRKEFNGISLWDEVGHKCWDEKMDDSKLYVVIGDDMMSTRLVYSSSGKFYRIFLEYLKGYTHE
jgi:hypothetical protein